MTSEIAAPELFEQGLSLLLHGEIDAWLELCATDVVFEFPFAPTDRPSKVMGRDALRSYMHDYPGKVSSPQIQSLRIHSLTDPGTIVVEMTMRGAHRASGTVRDSLFIAVATYRDGLLTHYRDYWNPNGGTVVVDVEAAA